MAYIGQSLTEGTRREYTYVATAAQTTFNAVYTVGAVDVYQNGVLLAPSDYTATDGTTVVLGSGAALNDEITIHCHNTFSVADTVSASQGGTFNGPVSVTGTFTSRGIDDNATATAMTLDGSGNLLVGKTSSSLSTAGAELRSGGAITGTVSNGVVAALNRLTNDGNIITFNKDGTTVGSIGVENGDLNINGPSGHSGIRFQAGSIMPRLNGVDSSGTIDLGYNDGVTTYAFKNLTLTGGVYLGGTGAANYLDDYEVGSWTGTAVVGAGAANIAAEGYIKVGDLVHVVFTVNFSGASGGLYVYGLPFAATNWAVGIGREDASSGYAVFTRITSGNSHTDLWYAGALNNATPFQVTGGNFRVSLTYTVA